MNTNQTVSVPTFEDIRAILKETAQLQKEYERERKEAAAELDREIKKIWKEVGHYGESQGSFAEEYFYNSFEKGQNNFFGKRFDVIQKSLKSTWKDLQDEYDIVLYNDDAVAIIEVKFKLRKDDIEKVLRKAETFKVLFPNYKDFKIYLGLASLVFPDHLKKECLKKGIAVIKQVGDTVVIIDEGLKAY